ncbi:LacI family DNA-binding transcriptional regulator [Oleiharenicola lentus]|uniref:LacI family DNA-binding transcriptional regulator n=1 Tax=Oleiharenicola lentus TaxID=2508720 RepID=UPI003F66AC5F
METVTLRALAELCGISPATVSRALSGHPNVSDKVRNKVLQFAHEHGYQRNQLISGVMAQVRHARTQHFVGNLAIVHVPAPEQPEPRPMQQRMIDGAKARAVELGFQIGSFTLGASAGAPATLARVLRARGVMGVVFLHSNSNGKVAAFPATDFAVVQIDYDSPVLRHHTVSLDHHFTLIGAMTRLRELGYRRAGLFIENHKDDRLLNKWSAAFRSFQENQGLIGDIPVLHVKELVQTEFMKWRRAHKPDLILGHVDRAVEWLKASGAKIPDDLGFFNLNWNERTHPCAGLDLRPELHGVVAVETLAAQIQRSERGWPADPRTVMFNGTWVDGPTVRTAPMALATATAGN